jgi:uncharacterized protein YecE (DUF72 family)
VKPVHIGCSGWNYASWRERFYPRGMPTRRWLAHYAEHFGTVEVNSTFYRLAKPAAVANWVAETPPDFVFAVKGGRFVTHMKRLRDVEVPLANFFASGVLALGPKLGPVLWQLPENLGFDAAVLDAFFALLPRTTYDAASLASRHDEKVRDDRALTTATVDLPIRHALEFRSPTFATTEALDVLRAHDVACVLADTAGRWPRVDADTAGIRYARLHGDKELYASGYTDRALDEWAAWCRRAAEAGKDVFVYFDNDMKGYAPHDAMRLIERLA